MVMATAILDVQLVSDDVAPSHLHVRVLNRAVDAQASDDTSAFAENFMVLARHLAFP